jgi:hypothetical protein
MTSTLSLETLPQNARLWVYLAERPFTANEIEICEAQLEAFIGQWQAHGASLRAGFAVQDQHLLLLAVDEAQAQATGCSIDSSVAAVRELGQQLGVDFFTRTHVLYRKPSGEAAVLRAPEVANAAKEGTLTPETLIFDLTCTQLGQLAEAWKPAKDTWVKRFF